MSRTILEKDERLIHPLHHPETVPETLVFDNGQGIYLHRVDGEPVIDGLSGLWNVNLGHGRPELAEAARRQMLSVAYMSNYSGTGSATTIELADRIAGFAYPELNATFFTSGGAESNESAFKTVRWYWKQMGKPDKKMIISRLRGYHGVTLAALSATGLPAYWKHFEPPVPGFAHINPPYPYRYAGELRAGETVGLAAARELEEKIEELGADRVGAFIAEPVMGAGGVIVPPDDYFPRVREICDRHDVLLIADEVITGWGRTGEWFGLRHWGVQPDLMSFAKAITSGYLPLGGIQVHDRIKEVMDTCPFEDRWFHSYTYSGHPTCCAVALANLDILQSGDYDKRARRAGAYLLGALRHLEEHDNVGEVRGKGMMLAVELVEDKESRKEAGTAEAVKSACIEKGLLLRVVGNIVVMAPPLIATDEELDRIAGIVTEAVEEVHNS